GYAIAARRFKSPVGEVDIVARRGAELLFVEVKARSRLDDAALSVTPRQRRRVVAAAEAWLAQHPGDRPCEIRFDVIPVPPPHRRGAARPRAGGGLLGASLSPPAGGAGLWC